MTTTTAADDLAVTPAQLWAALARIDAAIARAAALLDRHDTHHEETAA